MNLSADQIEYYSELLAVAFLDDPYTRFCYQGIERKRFLSTLAHKGELMELMQEGMVQGLDHRGLLVACRSTRVSRIRLFWRFYRASKYLDEVLTQKERKILKRNAKRARKVDHYNWQRKYARTKDYYYILYIAIAADARGKGTFRELILPHLEYCQRERIPAVLETHNPKNVPIYQHFGFEVVHIFEDERIPFKQYCMVKRAPN